MDIEPPEAAAVNENRGGATALTGTPDHQPEDSQRPRRNTTKRNYAQYENQYDYLDHDEPLSEN